MVPRWLPNAITVVRVVLVPVWVWLAFDARATALSGREPSHLWPVLVLLALGASDVLDGFLARRFHLATNFGATLDAVADKLAQVASVTFLCWLASPAFTPLPLWLWGALLLRDGLLGIGWVLVWRRHGEVKNEHLWHGRLSSVLLFALIVAATAHAPELPLTIASAVCVALVVPSTAFYMRVGWRQLHRG